ncbi:MAG TPA: hypothetical protein VGZ89_10575 [Xanthobacteraceae bacterium]|jgi:type I restriction enzyme R subunit|nr:hypothetical protein [Xanthobacteraceae bacterium]
MAIRWMLYGVGDRLGKEADAHELLANLPPRASRRLLRVDPSFSGLRKKITETASLLEELPNVPMVAGEMALILEIQTDEFWQDVTLPMLETVRRRLRALMKLIEYKKRPLVYWVSMTDRVPQPT